MNIVALRARRGLLACCMGLIAATAVIGLGSAKLLAAATPEETQKFKQAEGLIKTAETQARAKKLEEAGDSVAQAQKLVTQLDKVPEFTNQLAGLKKRLERLQGAVPKPADKTAAQKGGKANGKDAAGDALPTRNVSFVKHIAPILVTKCGRCHVNDSKGKFNMANFEALKRGTPDGTVIMPGKGSGSRLVEVIDSGDMPRGNGEKVTKAEQDAITKWIDEGAKFDGRSTETQLVRLVSSSVANAAKMTEPEELKVVLATGKEKVSYSKDIAPVLLSSCVDCHTATRRQGQLCMDNFNLLIKGGQSGNPWVPADAKESLLVKKLKGMVGQRMPLNRDPLPDDVIAKFEQWIAEGAKYDGRDPGQTTPILVRTTHIKSLTHDQLAKERVETSQQKWRLASPTGAPAVRETKNFLLIGRTSDAVLEEVATAAEAQATAVGRVFRAAADKPLVKGRITLFVFSGRYDYSEFGRMVEERQLPAEWRGHFGVDTTDVFGAFVIPDSAGGSDYSLQGVVGQQIAAAYVGSLSNVPNWFADGCGHAYAARVDLKAARIKHWNDRLAQVAARNAIDKLLSNGLSPEDGEAVSYGFVKFLMANTGKFNALMAALRNGEDFDYAFTRQFGPPKELLAAWGKAGQY